MKKFLVNGFHFRQWKVQEIPLLQVLRILRYCTIALTGHTLLTDLKILRLIPWRKGSVLELFNTNVKAFIESSIMMSATDNMSWLPFLIVNSTHSRNAKNVNEHADISMVSTHLPNIPRFMTQINWQGILLLLGLFLWTGPSGNEKENPLSHIIYLGQYHIEYGSFRMLTSKLIFSWVSLW